MLHSFCPRTVAALVACRRYSRRVSAFGTFAQRTIDRRYCGLPFIAGPAAEWYPRAVQLAGGVPSHLVWQPFGVVPGRAVQVRQSVAICHFCAGPIDAASRCACFAHV